MMNQSMCSYNKPPMTPSLKRTAPSSPANQPFKRRRIATPARTSTPRSVARPPQRKPASLLTPRRLTTPRRVAAGTPDRFIQANRTGTDVAKARRALLSREEEQCDTCSEYQGQLHQALFGSPANDEARLLSFSSTTKKDKEKRASESRIGSFESPFLQDTIRSSRALTLLSAQQTNRRAENYEGSIRRVFEIDAPELLENAGLKLVSYGNSHIALALNNEVYLWQEQEGGSACLLMKDTEAITCVQWSPSGRYVAIGCSDSLQIWCPRDKKMVCYLPTDAYVTAIAWRGETKIAFADEIGVGWFDDLTQSQPVTNFYRHKCPSYVSRLVWREDMLACAFPLTGVIEIRGTNQTDSVRTIKHAGVLDLKVHPSEPSILLSCGHEGIRFWEAHTGKLLYSLQTKTAVSGFVWSPFRRDEIAVAEESRISLWKLHNGGKRSVKVAELNYSEKTVVGLESYSGGKVICLTSEPRLAGIEIFRENRKPKPLMRFCLAIR